MKQKYILPLTVKPDFKVGVGWRIEDAEGYFVCWKYNEWEARCIYDALTSHLSIPVEVTP